MCHAFSPNQVDSTQGGVRYQLKVLSGVQLTEKWKEHMKTENEWISFYEWLKAQNQSHFLKNPKNSLKRLVLQFNIVESEEQPESSKKSTEKEMPKIPKEA